MVKHTPFFYLIIYVFSLFNQVVRYVKAIYPHNSITEIIVLSSKSPQVTKEHKILAIYYPFYILYHQKPLKLDIQSKQQLISRVYNLKLMFKQAFLTLLLIASIAAIQVTVLSKDMLDGIKQHQDFKHHFIFFDQSTLDSLMDKLETWEESDIKIYINDCRKNELPQCANTKESPVLLLFNRILIRFNGNIEKPEEIIEWGYRRINSSPKFISSREELDDYLTTTPNSYCFCQAPNDLEGTGLFYTLSKTLPFLNYCILNNVATYTDLGLKQNNVTLFYNNATNRKEFQYPNRFEAWEWFAKANMFSGIKRVSSIVVDRFAQNQKVLDFYALVCDFSMKCDHAWDELKRTEKELAQEEFGYEFRLALQDQKECFTFNLYYHFAFDLKRLPAIIHIDLRSTDKNAGKLVREVEYFTKFDKQTLESFITRTQKGEVKPIYLSADLPKNNGFYGKASQKFVQKVVASNVESVIAASQKNYLLLFTALDIGCEACQTFYKEYKQIASLLIDKDITFGILNVNLNEVSFKEVTQLPEILLFKKEDKEHPVRFEVSHNFDHLMLFLKNNLGERLVDPNEL